MSNKNKLNVLDISSTIFTNLSVFKSSKGASTSSNKQNGAGFRLKIANTKANAVSAFSPPESCEIDEFFYQEVWPLK